MGGEWGVAGGAKVVQVSAQTAGSGTESAVFKRECPPESAAISLGENDDPKLQAAAVACNPVAMVDGDLNLTL